MYTQPIKIVIIAAHFGLKGITKSSTVKKKKEKGVWKYNPDQRISFFFVLEIERLPNVGRATELGG